MAISQGVKRPTREAGGASNVGEENEGDVQAGSDEDDDADDRHGDGEAAGEGRGAVARASIPMAKTPRLSGTDGKSGENGEDLVELGVAPVSLESGSKSRGRDDVDGASSSSSVWSSTTEVEDEGWGASKRHVGGEEEEEEEEEECMACGGIHEMGNCTSLMNGEEVSEVDGDIVGEEGEIWETEKGKDMMRLFGNAMHPIVR